jgi:hypothetical protein
MKPILIIACSLAILSCDHKPTGPVVLAVPSHIEWGGAVWFGTMKDGLQKTPWIAISFLERKGGVLVQGFDSQEECRISRSKCTWQFKATFRTKDGPDITDDVMVTLYPDRANFKQSKVEFSSSNGKLPSATKSFESPDLFGHQLMAYFI